MDEPKHDEPVEGMPEPHVHVFGSDVAGWSADAETRRRMRQERREARQARRKFRAEWHEEGDGRYYRHRHHHGSAAGGLLILLVGLILLLNTFGLISWTFWTVAAMFWPVLLIVIGAQLLFGRNWFGRLLTFLIALVLFGFVILYGLIRVGSPIVRNLPPDMVQSVNGTQGPLQ